MSDEIQSLSAAAAASATADGSLDRAELFEHYRARADNDPLNAFTWVANSAPSPIDGPLGGVPLGVKDLFCTEGIPSQAGSKILDGYCPPYTATAVANLEAAGAPVLGKTNQDEFAMGSSNENSAYGPVLNPWDLARVPGGSSGGSAAAVAGGLAPWALGTDTGGSIRQPAALCGIVGLKPTYGAVSRYGMIAFASSLDSAGPLTRDVTDAALLYRHLVGRDSADATSVAFPEPIELPTAERLDGVTLAVPTEMVEGEGIEAGVRDSFEASLQTARDLGATIISCEIPSARYALSAYYVIAPAEASSNLSRFDGVRYGLRVEESNLDQMYTETRHDGFGAEVKRRILIGTYALSSGYYDAYYGRAQRVRTVVARELDDVFRSADLIVTPTSPTVAFGLGERVADPLAMYLSDLFTIPMSLAGTPAISIPSGLSEGLPVGLQICGPAFSENRILSAAHAFEKAIGFNGAAVRGETG